MKWLATAVLGAVMALLAATAALASSERDVSVMGLHGTVTLPEGGARGLAALILAGSGPTDRNGNFPGAFNDALKLVAHGLAAQGIASLRIDKRGIAASAAAGPREEDLRIETYVADAVAWLAVLRAEPGVSRVILVGHSEGALIATLVAQRTEVAGLVLLAGAGEPADRIIARQLAVAGVPADLQETSRRISESLREGRAVADVPTPLTLLYRRSVQSYLMSWLPIDPAAELARIKQPVLIVQGSTDIQITMDDARRLSEARRDAKLVVIEGMNHVLKEAPLSRQENLQVYARPGLPLAPALLPAIVEFLGSL
jgi:pimeloyl-ACP methyl ester carboxylesterase